MKKLKLILLIIAITFAVIFLVLFGIVKAKGKALIAETLSKTFKTETKIGYVSLQLPLVIEIGDFSCGDVSFKKVRVTPDIFGSLSGTPVLSAIDIEGLNIEVKIYKDKVAVFPFFEQQFPVKTAAITKEKFSFSILPCAYAQAAPGAGQPAGPPPFKINNLVVKDGTVMLYDLITNPKAATPVAFIFDKINAKVRDIVFPALTKLYVEAAASMVSENKRLDNLVKASGFVDLSRKDMDMDILINDFDYLILQDYYAPKWKPEYFGLKKAYLSVKTKLVSVNNDLKIKADFTVDKVEFREGGGSSPSDVYRTMFSLADDNKGKLFFSLEQDTKMDAPKIDTVSLSKQFTKLFAKKSLGNLLGNVLTGEGSPEDNLKNIFKK